MMKLTPHEKKILALIEKNPEIIIDTKKRSVIAKENGLSEEVSLEPSFNLPIETVEEM